MNLKDIDLLSKMTTLEVAIVTRLLKEADEKIAKVFEGQENDENNLTWQEATCIYLYTDEIFHQKLSKWKSSEIDIVNSKYWQEYECILINAINKCRQNIGKNGKIFYCGLHGLQMNFANSNKNVENKRSNGIISKQDMLSKEFVSFSKSFAVAASFCGENGIIFGIDNSNNSFNGADISKYSKYGTECEFLITRLQFECNRIEFILEKQTEKHQLITIVSKNVSEKEDFGNGVLKQNVFEENETALKFMESREKGMINCEIIEREFSLVCTEYPGENEETCEEACEDDIMGASNMNEDSDNIEGIMNNNSYNYDIDYYNNNELRRRKQGVYDVVDSLLFELNQELQVNINVSNRVNRRMAYQKNGIIGYSDDSLTNEDNNKVDKNVNNDNSCVCCSLSRLPSPFDVQICQMILNTFDKIYDSGNIKERREKVSGLVTIWKHCNNDTRKHLTYFFKRFKYLLKINKHKYIWDESKLMNEKREIDIKSEINKRFGNKHNISFENENDNNNNNINRDKLLFMKRHVCKRFIRAISSLINEYRHMHICATTHTLANLKLIRYPRLTTRTIRTTSTRNTRNTITIAVTRRRIRRQGTRARVLADGRESATGSAIGTEDETFGEEDEFEMQVD